MQNKKQLYFVISLLGLAVILVGIIVLYAMNRGNLVACPAEVRQCPDGSFVGREGPQCEFRACPTVPSASTGTEISFESIDNQSSRSMGTGVTFQENFTVLNQAEYNQLKSKLSVGEGGTDLPEIDFSKQMLIVALAGDKLTGGYGIEITKISRTGQKLFVQVESTSPGSSCINTQTISSSYHIVAIPAGDYQIEYIQSEKTIDCMSQY